VAIFKAPTRLSRTSARFVARLALPFRFFAHLTRFVLKGELKIIESELLISLNADKLSVEDRQFPSFLRSNRVAGVTFQALILTPPIVHVHPIGSPWAHAPFVIPKPSDTSINCVPTRAFGFWAKEASIGIFDYFNIRDWILIPTFDNTIEVWLVPEFVFIPECNVEDSCGKHHHLHPVSSPLSSQEFGFLLDDEHG